MHRPWFHSEGSHGRVSPFASVRRPFEADWPDHQSASPPAGPASNYTGDGFRGERLAEDAGDVEVTPKRGPVLAQDSD